MHIDIVGHGLTHFPLALTQLVTLQSLMACGNDFAEVPAAIRALSRLTQLSLGRMPAYLTEPDHKMLQSGRLMRARWETCLASRRSAS